MIEVDNLKKLLGSEFDVKDLGEGEKIIGMEILRDRILDVLYLCCTLIKGGTLRNCLSNRSS